MNSLEAHFTLLDWSVILLFLGAMLWIGFRTARRNRTASDYALGGRNMPPIMVGISLFATLLSTISYLAYPGELIKFGPVVFIGLTAFPVAYYIVNRWILPRFMESGVTSAYEILERRIGRKSRTLASVFFIALRFLWMATIVYATVDTALIAIFGVDPSWTPLLSLILVVITVIYTTVGGLKAVVLTDVIQTLVMFSGALLSIGIILWRLDCLDALFNPALFSHWSEVEWGFNPTERMTVGNIILMTFCWQLCTASSDQMAIQRYLSTRDLPAATRSYRISLITSCTIQLLLAVVGWCVMSYFFYFPQELAAGTTMTGAADTLFPRFIRIGLPAGVTGLIAAGIMSAAMSSLSSGLNSSATVIQEDFVSRFRRSTKNPTSTDSTASLQSIKRIAVVLGIIVAVASLGVGFVQGNLLDLSFRVVNLVVAPLFVLFFMALFVPFSTDWGVLLGGSASLAIAIAISFFGIFGLSALWIMPISMVVGIALCTLLSLLHRALCTNVK